MTKDSIYRELLNEVKSFEFDSAVAEVFDDMIQRSVPQYEQVQTATALLATRCVQAGTKIIDLGCSTGTTLIKLCQAIQDPSVSFVGIDNSAPMLERCTAKLKALQLESRVEVIEADILKYEPDKVSVLVLNYTLQFLAPEKRLSYLKRLYQRLLPGGALLLTEKVRHPDPTMEELVTKLYYDFKKLNGYSELEISQKREALEEVLIPLSLNQNIEMLQEAGFNSVDIFFKSLPFASLVGLKTPG